MNLDALAEESGFAGTETAAAIEMHQAVRFGTASFRSGHAFDSATVGQDGVNALRDFGDDTADLGREFARTMFLMQVAAAGFLER